MSITQILKSTIFSFVSNPKRDISYAWLTSLILVFIAFIVACITATKMTNHDTSSDIESSNQAASFSAVWTSILLIFFSIFGTIILRRYQNSIGIGVLLGMIFILCNQMLIIFALFVDQSDDKKNHTIKSSQEAMAVFSFFLFIVYSFFGGLLATFRAEIVKKDINDDTNGTNYSDSSFNHQNFTQNTNNYTNITSEQTSFDISHDYDDNHI